MPLGVELEADERLLLERHFSEAIEEESGAFRLEFYG